MQMRKQLGWVLAALLMASSTAWGQSTNGAIQGVVKDSSGGVVPDVALTLRNVITDQTVGTTVTGPEGEYAFRNLAPAKYTIEALKTGFQLVTQSNLEVALGGTLRVDITLPVGAQEQRVEVVGGASLLGVTGAQEHGISPETLQQLPLLMNSGPRAAVGFATLMPGVSTGGGNNAFDARINGGLQSGDEASLDGVSMQEGFMSQNGMVSIFQDFPMSPDMVSEVKVLTSSYAPEYGSSTGAQIMAVSKSGGSSYHGSVFDFHRDDGLKAKQWGASDNPFFKRDNFGVNVGGPGKVPGLWNDTWKTYFYFDYEGYRQKGGSNAPTLSIPSLAERTGDFRDWRDAQRQPDPDLRSGDPSLRRARRLHQGSVHGLRRPHAERDLCRPDRRRGETLSRRAAEPDQRRPAQQLPGAADSGLDPRRHRLLHGPRRRAGEVERPRLLHVLAPDGAGEVCLDAAAVDCQRVVLGSAELVGQPVQLRPDDLEQHPEPHGDGLPEPQ